MSKRLAKLERIMDDTCNLETIAPRDRELADVSYPHFPGVTRQMIDGVAGDCDDRIRAHLRKSSIRIWRRSGRSNSFTVQYGFGAATPAVLSRLEAAISARDPWRFQKAWDAISEEESDRIGYHIALRWYVRGGGLEPGMFGATAPLDTGMIRFSPEDDGFWAVALDMIRRRKRAASSRRRPRNTLGDRIALELARMWSTLAERPIVVPRLKDGPPSSPVP